MDADAIEASLEAVAAQGDPAKAVYARLFALHPELEALFILGDNAKGHMLDEVLRVILDHLGPRTYGAGFMRAEIVSHEQLGVPPDLFMRFFGIVRDAFREFAGAGWTAEMDAAWDELLAELQAVFG